jgi:RNA polymerase sigma-70 factor (ECF subfamily)
MQDHKIENESLLVRNLSKSNLLAFNTLYKEYSGRLYRFAIGYLKSQTEAEELVQDVFRIIWEKRADLKEELSFKSFLFHIAFNIIRKHFRTKSYLLEYFKTGINDDMDMLLEISLVSTVWRKICQQ